MQSDRSEAFSLLRKWRDDKELLSCIVDFELGRCVKTGRIWVVSEEGFILRSDADLTELRNDDDFILTVPPEASFEYLEPRDDDATAAVASMMLWIRLSDSLIPKYSLAVLAVR